MKDAKTIGGIDPVQILEILDRPPTEDEYEAAAETIEGIIHMAYLSLRHHHAGISEEEVAAIINIGRIQEVVDAMMPTDDKKKPKTLTESRSRGVLQSPSSSGSTKGASRGRKSKK